MSKNLSKKVLDEIKKKAIHPKPKWEFLLKDYVFWGAYVVLILVGSLAASVTIFRIFTNEWAFYRHFDDNLLVFTFRTLPYFWCLLLVIFVFIAYYNFQHTKRGYKYSFPLILGSSFVISVVLGAAFFGIGIAEELEDKALHNLPLYEDFAFRPQLERWSNAEKGVLGGEILSISENDSLNLENFQGEEWKILIEKVEDEEKKSLNTGMIIRIIGNKTGEKQFSAEEIHPWKGSFVRPAHMLQMPHKEKIMMFGPALNVAPVVIKSSPLPL